MKKIMFFLLLTITSCLNHEIEETVYIESPIIAKWETKRYFSSDKSGTDIVFRSNGTYLFTLQIKLSSGYDYLFESGTFEILNEITTDSITAGTIILYTDGEREESSYEIKACDVCGEKTLIIYDKYDRLYHIKY